MILINERRIPCVAISNPWIDHLRCLTIPRMEWLLSQVAIPRRIRLWISLLPKLSAYIQHLEINPILLSICKNSGRTKFKLRSLISLYPAYSFIQYSQPRPSRMQFPEYNLQLRDTKRGLKLTDFGYSSRMEHSKP
jgi:hypothetical protein